MKTRPPGRPRQLPVRTEPLSDVDAFWRLKAIRLNSFQAMRVMAFCSVWQAGAGSVDEVVSSGHCGRRTAFSRLASCRRAGFEPELVQFRINTGEFWEAEEREMIRLLERDYREDLARWSERPWPVRWAFPEPRPHGDLRERTDE